MIVELHPEELLDRESSGTLTDAERNALDAHSARCAACGCERRLRSEFAEVLDDGDGARTEVTDRRGATYRRVRRRAAH